jgi:site-specific DNA-methyltransferase (adenine-specific)
MTIYTGNGWEIREGRWQDSPLDECDHVISDPPYGKHTHKGIVRRHGGERGIETAEKLSFEPVEPSDITAPLIDVALRWVVLFCEVEAVGGYARAAGKRWIRGGISIRKNPTPQFSGDRPGQWGDCLAIMHRAGRKRWNGGGLSGKWFAGQAGFPSDNVPYEPRLHETQKPLSLMLDLVAAFTDPGELVWDPYCGSGTTGVACLRLGRRFIGHEMQPHYAKVAAERLEAESRGLALQAARQGQTSIFDTMDES